MAIVVLVLWAFTAGAGFYLLISSNLGQPAPARRTPAGRTPTGSSPAPTSLPIGYVAPRATSPAPAAASVAPPADVPTATPPIATAAASSAPSAATATPVAVGASSAAPSSATAGSAASPGPAAPSPQRVRDPWAPASLVAARQAPVMPGARALAEFAHPAAGVIGLGFWLGFTLIHARVLGWIGFGIATATACAGLAWFAANNRAAREADPADPSPSFATRLVALHGSGAALTVALAALTALLLRP